MDKHQKDYLAKKVQKMNPEWLKTGKFSDRLEKLNLINKKIFVIVNKIPRSQRFIICALIIADLGIYFKLFYDLYIWK